MRVDGTVLRVRKWYSALAPSAGPAERLLMYIPESTEGGQSERDWHAVFVHAPVALALLDLEGHWTEVNDALCGLLGYSRQELLALPAAAVTVPGEDPPEAWVRPLGQAHEDRVVLQRRYRHQNGQHLWMLVRVTLVRRGSDAEPAYLIGQYDTLATSRQEERHRGQLSLHDPLTGLAGRALLMDRLASTLALLPRYGTVLAVLMVDLDGLSPVNNHYGHLTGDQLLVAAADELLGSVCASDTVGRLGGDEFVVLSMVAEHAAAEKLRLRIARVLQHAHIDVPDGRIGVRASIGLAVTDHPGTDPETLLHTADMDMYCRKHQRR